MDTTVISETYSRAAKNTDPSLCCAIDYRDEFPPEEISHIPQQVLDRNYGCGIPPGLLQLVEGASVLDLGPGLGRDCFVAAKKVGPQGQVFGLDMNPDMLRQAERYRRQVEQRLGYSNVRFLEGRFDVQIPLEDESIDVIFSNCVNNLALDKPAAYREMFRVLRNGKKISFSDIVSYEPLSARLRDNKRAWADCVAGVLSYSELTEVLTQASFQAIALTPQSLWRNGEEVLEAYFDETTSLSSPEREALERVRLYSVAVEAFKPIVDPTGECYWRGQFALYRGPGTAFHLDADPDHVFSAGIAKEVCEKTATILKSEPFHRHFTVFEPQGEVEARLCLPGGDCC